MRAFARYGKQYARGTFIARVRRINAVLATTFG
jgi:hypothetical protein